MSSNARDQILEAATREMAARGADAATLQAIADAVGIRKPSVLYHFPSKEALRQAVLGRLVGHWNQALPRIFRATAGDGPGRFEAVMRELVHFFVEDPDRARLLLRELLDRPGEMRPLLAEHVRPWVDLVADTIRRGQAAGHIHADVDPEAYVMAVIHLTLASVALGGASEGIVDSDRLVTEVVRLARAGLFREARDG